MTFKKGDRVHVEFDGVVTHSLIQGAEDCWDAQLRTDSGADVYVRHEHLTLIEPKYEAGSYYIDATHCVYARVRDGWRSAVTGAFYPDSQAVRPLRKLVPEQP